MVKIRMKRMGRKNRPFFRIGAIDTRQPRDGSMIEILGHYDPHGPDDSKVVLDDERVKHWLDNGAQPSTTVASFLRKRGLL